LIFDLEDLDDLVSRGRQVKAGNKENEKKRKGKKTTTVISMLIKRKK
jgi:hypothetical protein